jgi:lipopolysaccharide transport system ATP-binding protein
MDEVLAVGDLNFQKKCFDQILQLKKTGTAIILVSHSPGAIWSVCDRGLFMDHGRPVVEGGVEDVVRAYDDQNSRNAIAADQQFSQAGAKSAGSELGTSIAEAQAGAKIGTGDVVCTGFRIIRSESGAAADELDFREPFCVEVDVTILKPIDDFILRVVADAMHYRNIATLDNYEQGRSIPRIEPGQYRFRIDVEEQNFRPGAYVFNVAAVSRRVGIHLFLWLKCARIIVKNPTSHFLYSDPMAVMFLDATYSHVRLETIS